MSVVGALTYTWSTATAGAPTGNQIRLDAPAPYSGATMLAARLLTDDGFDAYHVLLNLAVGALLVLQDENDHARYVLLTVRAAPVDQTDYIAVPVTYAGGAGALTNNQQVAFVVARDAPTAAPPPPTYIDATVGLWTLPNVSLLVVPPATEPLTLDEAKLRAGLTWAPGDERDAQMRGFIRAARERVERDTGYALLTQTRDVYLSHYVHPSEFPGPARPLQSITEIVSPEPSVYPWVRRVVVGWTDVIHIPPLLSFAVGLLTAHYATAARDVVVIGTIAQTIPLGYEDAIADYRRVAV